LQTASLTLPPYEIKIRYTHSGNATLYDPIRKKWYVYTPEEWVRQHVICHLLSLGYPEKSIAVEKKLLVNGLLKRFDLLVYHQAEPLLLCECKAPDVKLSNETWHQAMRYNTVLQVPFLLITNGIQHATLRVNATNFVEQIESFPSWDDLIHKHLKKIKP